MNKQGTRPTKQLAAAEGAKVGNEKVTLITAGFWGHHFPGHLHP